MRLRWKRFESGVVEKQIPMGRLGRLFGIQPSTIRYQRIHPPVLQFSHNGIDWHDVPSCDPIPYEEWIKDGEPPHG